jgi:small-conductance mechanosensitive channel
MVIALVADLVWFVLKAMIERRLAEAQGTGPGGVDPAQTTRIRTVLPILRNVAFVTLAVIAVLMALSALGVDIAPMVAGAGVVGIAVGFGAQTLVKDIVSGVFFLFDDAFRVGEYIQSGSYKGTVESFSLRSVRLRHHRGPVYTVPFGELGAVQNMSRDWVIDKLSIGITYDSDLEKARKLIKKIGQELAADPEMGPNILEPTEDAGRRAVRRLRDPDPHEDDDPPRRAVRGPAQGIRGHQDGVRRQWHQVRVSRRCRWPAASMRPWGPRRRTCSRRARRRPDRQPQSTMHAAAIASHRFGYSEPNLHAIGSDPRGWVSGQWLQPQGFDSSGLLTGVQAHALGLEVLRKNLQASNQQAAMEAEPARRQLRQTNLAGLQRRWHHMVSTTTRCRRALDAVLGQPLLRGCYTGHGGSAGLAA